MRSEYIRLAALQSVIIIMGAAVTNLLVAQPAAKSFAYGSTVVLVSTLILSWRFRQGARQVNLTAEWCLRQAYKTAFERFAIVIFLLALGFKLLKFAPLWMLVGFVAAQSAWLVIPVWIRLRTSLDKTENKK